MTAPFIVDAQHRGRLFGRRTHHGAAGCVLLVASVCVPDAHVWLRSALAGVGAALCAHDWADRGHWVGDFLAHPAVWR